MIKRKVSSYIQAVKSSLFAFYSVDLGEPPAICISMYFQQVSSDREQMNWGGREKHKYLRNRERKDYNRPQKMV
jgi:hypothetical protein